MPQVKREPTFRIRGVPNDWDRDKLGSFLIERDSPAVPEVKSLNKEFHGRSQTATVSFRNICQLPLRISLPSDSGQFGGPRNLTLDRDFFGITSLFVPSPQTHKVDIIAISGLGGHAFGSFKERGGEHMWLRDSLPYDITGESGEHIARIMVYGYESSLPKSDSFQNIEDLGTTLHSDLRTLIFEGSFKPIVFIAHSLGGLIIKQLLMSLSKSLDEIDRKLRCAVYGIAFFGVPHDGMDIRSLIPMSGDGPNRFLLESMGFNSSQILSIQQREFSEALGGQGESEIFSFYETRLSPTALQDESGRWTMSGEPAVLVSKASATHCRPWENGPEHICAINRTHSELVKFTQDDPEYDRVLGRIKSLAQRAITARKSTLQPNLSQEEQKCLHSLAFTQMQDRDNDIEDAVSGTCEWLLGHNAYIRWAASRGNLLWIKGKPGAGKSTLLKYTLSKQRDISGAKENDLVMSFFFHGRGGALQKTPLGFLRSILHQILKQVPKALSELVSAYQQKCRDMGDPPEKWQWHTEELWHFFKSSLPKILADRSIWLFVDALDECGEVDARQLVERFKSLAKLTPLPEWIYFRICFSCRHYPILSSPGLYEICLEMENKNDISTYVRSELRLSSFEKPKLSLIRNLIILRASGIFLWARLVVRQVQDLELDGAGSNKIEATIRSTPKGLHELYKELINGMKPSSLKLIQWVCFAMRPLSMDELRWALVIDARFPSLQACQNSEDYIPDSIRMKQQVIKLSRGLAEVTADSDTQVVQFIHQSVKDFFTSEGLVALDDTSASANEEVRDKYSPLRSPSCVVREDDRAVAILDSFTLLCVPPLLTRLVGALTAILGSIGQITTNIDSRDENGWTPLAWAAKEGHEAVVKLLLQAGAEVDSKDIFDRTPLLWASRNRHGAIVKLLHDAGAEINSKDSLDNETPLSWASEQGHEAMVELLLQLGASVNSKAYNNRTPLSWAATEGHEAVVTLLLQAGAEIDLKDIFDRTPLSWASENGHEAVTKLLLDAGAEGNTKDKFNWTPLLWASESGHEAVFKLLHNAGAEVDLKDSFCSQTPLSWASEKGHEAMVKLLLNAGAKVNSKDKYNRTPLSWASENGHDAVVKLLLSAGAEVDSRDIFDRTPLSQALENEHEAVVKLLLNSGAAV
ncbi:ankyrin repeat-containing domain protein [Trichoderma velutinum]